MSDNIIQLNETLIKDHLKNLVRNSVEETLNVLLDYGANELGQGRALRTFRQLAGLLLRAL